MRPRRPAFSVSATTLPPGQVFRERWGRGADARAGRGREGGRCVGYRPLPTWIHKAFWLPHQLPLPPRAALAGERGAEQRAGAQRD